MLTIDMHGVAMDGIAVCGFLFIPRALSGGVVLRPTLGSFRVIPDQAWGTLFEEPRVSVLF